jgi:hypothetical protein
VLSPNNAIVLKPSLFKGYYDQYVNEVWQKHTTARLLVNTQAQWGTVAGTVVNDKLVIDGCEFAKPTAADIFSCSIGPFEGGSPEKVVLIPRIAAAFNRSTLLKSLQTPDTTGPASFYKGAVTNHYSRVVHEQLLDSRGYAFPYDDVCADGGPDQCGAVFDSNPKLLTVAIGGNGAYVDPDSPVINV